MSNERMKIALKGALKALFTSSAIITGKCSTRIHDSALPVVRVKDRDYPQLTFQVTWTNAAHRLPSAGFDVKIHLWVPTNRGYPKTTMDTLEQEVFDLLHGEVGEAGVTNLNAQAFTVRCRRCNLVSSIEIPEPEANLLHTSMTFTVVLGTT